MRHRLPPPDPRTEGERLLRALPGTQHQIAARCGLDQRAIAKYALGRHIPAGYARRKAIELALGIPVDAWDRPPKSPVRRRRPHLAA